MTATDVAEVVANVVAVLAGAGLRVVEHIAGIVVYAVHCCPASSFEFADNRAVETPADAVRLVSASLLSCPCSGLHCFQIPERDSLRDFRAVCPECIYHPATVREPHFYRACQPIGVFQRVDTARVVSREPHNPVA